ncbi:MAG: response regulator [Desulfuromonadales bacterium]|nr:response regulator [Desulfuromonadales bacterium]
MSLVGNLEDLGLGEILQIINLSRKSGTLTLRCKGHEAAIVFRYGQVVRASSSMFPQSLGELLTKHSVIDPTILRKALALQQSEGFLERLGSILVKNFDVNQEVIEEVVRAQVEKIVVSLFDWTSGSFDFLIQDLVETVYDTRMDPLQFMLNQGLNPQYLAMEGAQAMDEKRQAVNRGDFGPQSGSDTEHTQNATRPTSVKGKSHTKNPLVMVDDDGPTLQAVAAAMRELGYDVHAMTRSEDTLIKVDSLIRGGAHPTILIDLIMPKMDGSGVLGGIELMELLHSNFKDLNIIVMTDYQHAEAETKVHDRGYPFIMKPRRPEIGKADHLGVFIGRLQGEILLMEQVAQDTGRPERFNLGDELRMEMDDSSDFHPLTDTIATDGPSLLKCMLEELNNPDQQGGVLLLVLRFASEFLNRAIVFMVHDRVVSGVGQFGISDGIITGDEKVRAINFPLESDSLFSNPGKTLRSTTCKPDITPVDAHIFKQLGGGIPAEVFVGPITSNSRLIGFLYGDNLPDDSPLLGTDILGIFLSQAGIAMEQGLRSMRLNTPEQRDNSGS